MLQQTIKDKLKKAMMEKNAERVGVLRMVSAAFTNEMVSEARIASGKTSSDPLSDEEAIKVIKREVKKRKDAIEQFTSANRRELAEGEAGELKVLEEFLPAQMSREEIHSKVSAKLAESPIDVSKKGQFIGMMMKELGSNADGLLVKEVVDELIK